jgi:putative hydrolase of the HAD superfamily
MAPPPGPLPGSGRNEGLESEAAQVIAPGAVDALLFDLGGVVIEIDFDRVFARWGSLAGRDPAAIKGRFAFDSYYERHERGEIGAAAYFASLRASLGIDLTDAQFAEGWREIFVGEVPGVAAVLRRARERLPLFAFTNSNPAHQEVWRRRFPDPLRLFRSVFVSSELGKRKPEPAAYRAVALAIGAPADRIAFFDDSPENVKGAQAIGMRAVHVKSPADLEASLQAII